MTACGEPLIVQRYGGGMRYYCPRCDVRRSTATLRRITSISWTHASPPQERLCPNILPGKALIDRAIKSWGILGSPSEQR